MADKPVRQRIEEFAELNPDATVPQIAGALGVDPSLVVDVLDQESEYETDERPTVDTTDDGLHREPIGLFDFDDTESDTFPETLPDQWLVWASDEKRGYAPWGDSDAPAECKKSGHETANLCDCDARHKWSYPGNWASRDEAQEWVEMVPTVKGFVWIQSEEDGILHIDGDNVICPETGAVHPVFEALISHLGETYVDVSTSGTGGHGIYTGELPEGFKQIKYQIEDEPWGANEEPPGIEIYDGLRNIVMTGDHVAETPTEPQPANEDVLVAIAEANTESTNTSVTLPDRNVSREYDDFDSSDHDPDATSSDEYTDNIEDIFYALDQLDARDVADKTIVHRWNDDANTSDGYRAFVPKWGKNANGTANIVNENYWEDTGDVGGWGQPAAMAAIDAGIARPHECPRKPRKGDWFEAVEHLRKLGFDIPRLDTGNENDDDEFDHAMVDEEGERDPDHKSIIPSKAIESMEPHEMRRYARKRAPSTDDARDRLQQICMDAMEDGEYALINSPTSLGKSHTMATTDWGEHDDVTGGKTVVLLEKTIEARDDVVELADEEGIHYKVLEPRHVACDVAGGKHDPDEARKEGRQVVTVDGRPASKVIEDMCDSKIHNIPFSNVHDYVERNNDQGLDELPCCQGVSDCEAFEQYEDMREEDYDLVIATHNFAHVPSLRMQKNVVYDEQPDFTVDIPQDRIRRSVTAFLRYVEAPIGTWEGLIRAARASDDVWGTDAGNELEQTRNAIQEQPTRDWYLTNDDAHTLAPAIARAILRLDEEANGRWSGKVAYDPPRLDASVHDDSSWANLWVSVTIDDDNTVRRVQATPDMSLARSVIGLDAHPTQHLWEENGAYGMKTREVLDPEERHAWRLLERGLTVVQLGEATRPFTKNEYFHRDRTKAVIEGLRDHYGDDFSTVVTAKGGEGSPVAEAHREIMEEVGVVDPGVMTYGEEKSRNDFGDEKVGLVNGCIDPGDDYVLDLLAQIGLDAEPETKTCPRCGGDGCDDDKDCKNGIRREKGREFVGPDADAASELLASVRENHVAQAAGRWARNPDDPDSRATVYVRTDAMPPGFADLQVPDTVWTWTEEQREVIDELVAAKGQTTAPAIAENVSVTAKSVRRTLNKLLEAPGDLVEREEAAGPGGAHLWRSSGDIPEAGVFEDEGTEDVMESYTWTVRVSRPDRSPNEDGTETAESADDGVGEWAWEEAYSEGDPPD